MSRRYSIPHNSLKRIFRKEKAAASEKLYDAAAFRIPCLAGKN
jgi:hypothetical protein